MKSKFPSLTLMGDTVGGRCAHSMDSQPDTLGTLVCQAHEWREETIISIVLQMRALRGKHGSYFFVLGLHPCFPSANINHYAYG